jgi:hypothetical protein
MRKILLTLLLILTACACLGPFPVLAPQPSPTPAATFNVIIHPDGGVFVGDKVSFEIFSPASFNSDGKTVRISLAGKPLGEKSFEKQSIGQRNQVTFNWVWDTSGLKAGDYTLTFNLLPNGSSWEQKVSLRPASDLPTLEKNARWQTTESACCIIHTISGSDAANDIDQLKAMADAQATDVEHRLGAAVLADKIPVTFLPRVLGHGGFTSDAIYVTYMHQNYAGGTTQQVTHHEMVHWVDGKLGSGGLLPSMLREGLAVYLSEGHFKIEPIVPRSAAILELGWYIPIRKLADAFYFSQHEISYMEAASLISYMVKTYGWERFNAFYRDIHPAHDGSEAAAIDNALQVHFKISLDSLEKDYLAFLRGQTVDDATRTDMRLTVAFYDSVRRYQVKLDPSAYFMNAWMPDAPSMRQRNIVADYLRHPASIANRQIESLLVSGDANLRGANYALAETDIRAVNILLDLLDRMGK